jgi:PKD repeat protein
LGSKTRNSSRMGKIALLLLVGLFIPSFGVGLGGPTTTVSLAPVAATNTTGAYFDHAVIIVMEDHGINEICAQNPPPCMSSNGAPYSAGLANKYGIGSQYLGISHFSQANYVALLGGDIYGCVGYPCQPSSHANLVDRFEAAGLTWHGYMEDQALASGCDTSSTQLYNKEHNPFVFFTDITSNPARCANVLRANPTTCSVTDCVLINDLNSASAPNFMFLTPNECDNMHGATGICPVSISMGDQYLSSLVPNILNSQTFTTQRGALFIVFDEGQGYCPLNNSSEDCVYAVWAGPAAKTGFSTTNLYNHYSFTKTIETNWNLASLASNDAAATPMTEFFTTTAPPPLSTSFTYTPSSPSTGQTVTFTGSATGGTAPYSFNWNFGDGTTGTGATVSHSYAASGSLTVGLSTTDAKANTASSSSTITISPVLTVTATIPSTGTVGSPVSVSASASGGSSPYTFSWSFGDGTTNVAGPTASHTYTASGSYVVRVSATDSASQTASASSSITINPAALTTDFTHSPTIVQTGTSVSFTATVSGGTGPYTYSWSLGDGSSASGNPVSHSYATIGTFTVQLLVTDSVGANAAASHIITVTQPAQPDFAITSNPSTLRIVPGGSGSSVITLTSTGGFTGTINLSSNITPSGPSISLSPAFVTLAAGGSATATLRITTQSSTPTGTYTATITGTSNSLSHSSSVSVTVQGASDFSLSASPSSIGVHRTTSGTVTLTLTSLNGFNGTVNLSVTVSRSGLRTTLSSASVNLTPGGTSNDLLTIHAGRRAPTGTYTVTITATSGTIRHTTTITVNVT